MQMLEGGFVVLHRSILNWGWYLDGNTKNLFIHLLLTANYAPGVWKGRKIEAGQRLTSVNKLSLELGLSNKQIRTSLKHLQETGEVACESTSQYTVITVKNYEKYQRVASASASGRANDGADGGQARGKRRANEGQQRNKNNKNNKKKENIKEKSGADGPPPEGGRLPAIGEGPCLLEINGENYRFPESWYTLAEERGVGIEEYVRWRNQ